MPFKLGVRHLFLTGLALVLATTNAYAKSTDDKLQVVSSFSIVTAVIEQVGGDQVDVYNIIPSGDDPHEWSPSPLDTKKTADADAVFYFGWNLEGQEDRQGNYNWVKKLLKTVHKDPARVFTVSAGIEQRKLAIGRNEGTVNPHAFISPKGGIEMAKNVRDALIEVDPEHERAYQKNAQAFLKELKAMDRKYQQLVDELPPENRVMFTGERAFQYLTADYGLKEGFIWEFDGNQEGTPSQIKSAIQFVNKHQPPALFYEYNDDKRPMNTVSDATGVKVSGTLYSDDMGDAKTYMEYLEHNYQTIKKALSPSDA